MFFSFSPTEILYIFSRVLLYVLGSIFFRFNFPFCVNNGSEKEKKKVPYAASLILY